MINISTKQLIAISSVCATITVGSVIGIIVLETRRKAYLEELESLSDRVITHPVEHIIPQAVIDAVTKDLPEPDMDIFGPVEETPVEPVATPTLPKFVDVLDSGFAQTRGHRYAIYADVNAVRPGEFEHIQLDFYAADNMFVYNGILVYPHDVEHMFGRDFAEEVLSLGIGRELQLVIFSNVMIDDYLDFFRIVLTFYEGSVPDGMFIDEDDDILAYDPDSELYSDTQQEDEDFDEIEEMLMEHDSEIQEAIEEVEAMSPFFDRDAAITIDPFGELTEVEIYHGWTEQDWTFLRSTGLLYDEEDEVISEDEAIEWLGIDNLSIICANDSILMFPNRTIYVRNGKLKIMYEITLN